MYRSRHQAGYSLIELMIAMAMMLTIMALVMRYMNNSVSISLVTTEMTEAQQNLRTAQEFIASDLVGAADGMEDIKSPRLTKTFLGSYLTKAAVSDASNTTLGVLGVITSDDQVPSGTAIPVPSPSPAATIPVLQNTDRLTIMRIDTTFNPPTGPIILPTGSVTGNGLTVALPAGTNMALFNVGDIYFFTSTVGSAFGAVTAVNSTTRVLTFNTTGDRYGLNQVASTGPINSVAVGRPASLMRMLVINYYIDSDKLLRRRIYGVSGGFTDTVVAEHVADLQFRYILGQSDANGNVLQPVTTLANETQQGFVRQVEVTVTTETARNVVVKNGQPAKQQISMTATTAVRNMQFNIHLKAS